jgi:hypothetical protein
MEIRRMTQARVFRDGARGVAKRDVVKHCRSHKKAARVLEKLQIPRAFARFGLFVRKVPGV